MDGETPNLQLMQQAFKQLELLVSPDFEGWTREVFSEEYAESRNLIRRLMQDAGLEVRTDPAGNIIGTRAGRISRNGHTAPALVTGSHTDTVRNGGRYDGVAGVLASLEIAHRLREEAVELDHDLVVVDFLGEEANPFGSSCLGSRALAGELSPTHLTARRPLGGETLGDRMRDFGLDPGRIDRARWDVGAVLAFVELHIEQGPKLHRNGIDLGVVTSITGIDRMVSRFSGQRNHAGTTAMNERRDALLAAAEAVLSIEAIGCGVTESGVGGVGTAVRIEQPVGPMNAVPHDVRVAAEFRSESREWLNQARDRLLTQIADQAAARGVAVDHTWLHDSEVVLTSNTVQSAIATAARERGYTTEALPSGAGHDSAHMAALGPAGMIFVPSIDGLSHCPEEFTPLSMFEPGVAVLFDVLKQLDAE